MHVHTHKVGMGERTTHLPPSRSSYNSCQNEWCSRDATRKTRLLTIHRVTTSLLHAASSLPHGPSQWSAQSPAPFDVLLALETFFIQEHPHFFGIQQRTIDLGVARLHKQYQVVALEAAAYVTRVVLHCPAPYHAHTYSKQLLTTGMLVSWYVN